MNRRGSSRTSVAAALVLCAGCAADAPRTSTGPSTLTLLYPGDAELERLLSRSAEALDPAERARLQRQTAEILRAELPVTFLYPLVFYTAAHRRLRGLSSPDRSSPEGHADALWLEEGR